MALQSRSPTAWPRQRVSCIFLSMRTLGLTLAGALCLARIVPAQSQTPASPSVVKTFPEPDFILRDVDLKQQKSGLVLGPMESDGRGGTKGSFAVYGGSSLIQVLSLSFSGDGRILAVGSTPGRIDLWDVANKKKLRTLNSGTTVALSPDGHLLAKYGNGIELYDVASGELSKRIPRALPKPNGFINAFTFSPAGTLLDVTANGEDDTVYDVSTGKLVATLTDTKAVQFSADGSLLVGGNYRHLIVWKTTDWSKVSDLPNGPDYVTHIAALPEKDLVVVGGPKVARLLRLSSGEELAKVGVGYTNFAEFNQRGTLIFTYQSSGFAVWDTKGKEYCTRPDIGNGTVALSPDNRWLAAAPVNGGTTVSIWNLPKALAACGVPASDAFAQVVKNE